MKYSWFSDLIKINTWHHEIVDSQGDCMYYANEEEGRTWGSEDDREGMERAALMGSTVEKYYMWALLTDIVLKVIKGQISNLAFVSLNSMNDLHAVAVIILKFWLKTKER